MTKHGERTILVTGATGTVGSEVVKQLASSSSSSHNIVRAAVHSQGKADKFKRDNRAIELVNIDYNRPETIADALNEVDKLFLLIPPSPSMINISSNLMREAKKNDIKYIKVICHGS